jgi:NADH-quinone oxidoreductase subunit E
MTPVAEMTAPPPAASAEPDSMEVLDILAKHENSCGELIAILEEIQARFGYLPEEALRIVSRETGASLVDVYGIATFYRLFSLKPRGKHLVCACLGTACHVRGAAGIVDELKHQLGVQPGETTPDGEFSLETANCLGACALGPIVVIDGRYFSKVRKRKVRELLDAAKKGFCAAPAEGQGRLFPVQVSCPHCNHSLMDPSYMLDNQPSIRVAALANGHTGRLRLSSLFGSYRIASDWDIPRRIVTRLFCPHCHEELCNGDPCPMCEAPAVPLIVEGGGTLDFCSRRGCGWHQLNLI